MKYSILVVLDNDSAISHPFKLNTSSGHVIIVFSHMLNLEEFVEAISAGAAEFGGRPGAVELEASSMSEAISKLKNNMPADILGQATFLADTDPLYDQIVDSLFEAKSG